MGNTFLTPTNIADMGLLALEANMVAGGLVYRGHDKEFKKGTGDTAKVRRPATFTAIEFDGDLTGEFQEITEGSVDVKLDKIFTVPFEVTQKQASLDVKDLNEQVVTPAAQALADKIDSYILGFYYTIPYYQDVSGTPVIGDIAGCRKVLNVNKAPTDTRFGILHPDTEVKYNVLDAFVHAEKRGDTKALKEGSMGRLYGIDWYMGQNVQAHTKGTVSTADKITLTKTGDALNIEAVSDTCTVMKGDIIKASDGQEFTILEDSGDITTGNSKDLSHHPAVSADVTQETITAVHADHKANLVAHRNAICLATAPLAEPLGGANASVRAYKGLSLQVVFSFNHNALKNVGTMSILCGVKTLQEELGMRLAD